MRLPPSLFSPFSLQLAAIMSTAKRLVLSLRGRKESHGTAGTSSTRLVSANSTSPGHELDEIAVVSVGAESGHVSYGSLSLGHTNGPRYIPGKWCASVLVSVRLIFTPSFPYHLTEQLADISFCSSQEGRDHNRAVVLVRLISIILWEVVLFCCR